MVRPGGPPRRGYSQARVSVGVDGDSNRAVSHLVPRIGQTLSVLNEMRGVRLPPIPYAE